MILKYLNWKHFKDTYGAYAMASILICAVSGAFLAIPYDVGKPYESISQFIILIPSAAFIRNIHYWSAQLFLVFTILHIWDHFRKKSEKEVKKNVWLRLTLSIIVTFFVMLSGFIIKGDADSLQARQILTSLINSVPLIGNVLEVSLLGNEGSFQLLYVHHIATATIILFILIYEHARMIWGKAHSFFLSLVGISLLAYWIQAPLHDNLNPVLKGPWYFTGIQEILHHLKKPEFSLVLVFAVLLLIYLLPFFKEVRAKQAKVIILIGFVAYAFLTLTGFYLRGENWKWIQPWNEGYLKQVYLPKPERIKFDVNYRNFEQINLPTCLDRKESCLLCHSDMSGFTASHNPQAIGCTSCHGGNPFSADKKQAHKDMFLIPGNLADARQSCGTTDCHPEIAERVPNSIMATMSGVVSVNKWVFGEYDHPSILSHIQDIQNSPADMHLKNLCASCHLGNEKESYGPIVENSRGGGCIACHLQYTVENIRELAHFNKYREQTDTLKMRLHPAISIEVDNRHCFGCHSRSGRISLSYEGWHESGARAGEIKITKGFRELDDKRVVEYIQADVHHEKGLLCIDCHTSYELMGDGSKHAHKEEQLVLGCSDCHFYGKPKTMEASELDRESAKIFHLRNYQQDYHKFLVAEKTGQAIINSYVDAHDSAWLFSKNSGEKFPLRSPSALCARDQAHEDVACITCHTAWVPRCIGCHTEFDPEAKGLNLLSGERLTGKWVEYAGEFVAGKPTMGVRNENGQRHIVPVMPGMVMTIDKSHYPKVPEGHEDFLFNRLYAPANPHTVIKPQKNCKACHTDPVMLGFGSGQLLYEIKNNKGKWNFIAEYQKNENDQLPEDAWTGFLSERDGRVATRPDLKPFSLEEQKRLLTVGACFECHEENQDFVTGMLEDFESSLQNRTEACILPAW